MTTWSADIGLTLFLYCWRIFQLNSSRIYYVQFYQLLVAATLPPSSPELKEKDYHRHSTRVACLV